MRFDCIHSPSTPAFPFDKNAYLTTTYRTYDRIGGAWMQVDPKAESVYNMTPYCSMNNNPISYTDPEGDIAFVPILIGAAVGDTIGGIQHGWDGVWKGALTGAIGGTLGQFGGGSLIGNIAWGTGEVAITGDIGSALNGCNFLNGAKWGAISAAGT